MCRRPAFEEFREAWGYAAGHDNRVPADAIDHELHFERLPATKEKPIWTLSDLPDGCFFTQRDAPAVARLVWREKQFKWRAGSYELVPSLRSSTKVSVVTPWPLVGVLRAGYQPQMRVP